MMTFIKDMNKELRRSNLTFFIACMGTSYFSSKLIRPFVFSRRQSLINPVHLSLIRSLCHVLSLSLCVTLATWTVSESD